MHCGMEYLGHPNLKCFPARPDDIFKCENSYLEMANRKHVESTHQRLHATEKLAMM